MKKAMQKLKDKKGFTLVEVIVVLVILAILAAIAIPALTGYISKAQEKTATAEARTAFVAVQTLASDQFAEHPTATKLLNDNGTEMAVGDVAVAVEGLSGQNIAFTAVPVISSGKVNSFTITASGGYSVAYAGGKYTVTKIS